MKSWEREKLNKDKSHKNKVLKSLKKKPDFKKIRKEAEKKFQLRKVIERTFLGGVEQGHFVCGNDEWGYNQHTTNMNYYNIILKEYKVYTGQKGDKFEKKVLDLLNKSKNQTPKTTIFVIDSSGISFCFNNLIRSSDAFGFIGLLKSPSNNTSFIFL